VLAQAFEATSSGTARRASVARAAEELDAAFLAGGSGGVCGITTGPGELGACITGLTVCNNDLSPAFATSCVGRAPTISGTTPGCQTLGNGEEVASPDDADPKVKLGEMLSPVLRRAGPGERDLVGAEVEFCNWVVRSHEPAGAGLRTVNGGEMLRGGDEGGETWLCGKTL